MATAVEQLATSLNKARIEDDGSAPVRYEFTALGDAFPSLEQRDVKDGFMQWGLAEGLVLAKFKFGQRFMPHDTDTFLCQLMGCPEVAAALKVPCKSSVQSVEWEKLSCTAISMDFFGRLKTQGIVSDSGHIKGCWEETFDRLTVADKLQEMLVNADSEAADVYSQEEKAELLYRVFKAIVAGGGMCQPDDKVDRYLQVTKLVYKDLVSVYKSPSTGRPEIASKAFLVSGINGDPGELFPKESDHHACLVVVDPTTKHVAVLKKEYKPFW